MEIPSLASVQVLSLGLGLSFFYLVILVLYRRYLHPLSHVPGPFLYSVTRLCLWYHNVVREGQLYLELVKLHEQYGPVVRISPNEVHLNDPDNYDKIYNSSGKYTKDPIFYKGFGFESFFTTCSNALHRKRRGLMNPFFSRRSVLELEHLVIEKMEKMCQKLGDNLDAKQPVDITAAFKAVSIDVITDYAFDDCWDQIDREDLGSWFTDLVRSFGGPILYTFQQWPIMVNLALGLPEMITMRLGKDLANFVSLTKVRNAHPTYILYRRRDV
jgi:hypothetical protein